MKPSIRDFTNTLAIVWTVPMVSIRTGIGCDCAVVTTTGAAGATRGPSAVCERAGSSRV